ncbi:glutaredoxin domain-containing protein [Marinobacter sp. TBZ242]|uniref:Glutaredoxin domain-containing protein n=1 Tax=Marinobacter azerbaijanicus TaxID=3050455 RepID=A0ABT7IF77_9GAMM|nr:glutaredoxin domain-containing protein [Marinobacter sp. TBZ242]MDL0432790.1 glutaredoxin domain-containing protein [Marinobacter sp. TBZ242]
MTMFSVKTGLPVVVGAFLIAMLPAFSGAAEVYDKPPEQAIPQVVLFSQPFCPGCEAAKDYFQTNEIPYVEFDITASTQARKTFERLGGRGTPLLLIDGQRVHGFSIPAVEQGLQGAGLLEDN